MTLVLRNCYILTKKLVETKKLVIFVITKNLVL